MRTLLRDLGTVSGVQCACIFRGGQVLASSFPENDAVSQAASLGFVRGISDGLELVDRGFEELLIDFGGKSLIVTPIDKDFVLAMLAASDANLSLLRVVMGSSVRQLRRMHDLAEKPEPAPAPAAKPEPAAAPVPAGKPAAAAAPPPQASQRPQPAGSPPPSQGVKPQPTGRPQPVQQSKPAPPPPPPLKGQQAARPPQPAAQQAAPAKPSGRPEPAPAPAPKVADKDAEPVLPQVLALLTEYIGPVARVSFKRGVTRWRETSTPTIGTLGELAKILAADLSSDSEKKAFLDAVERLRSN